MVASAISAFRNVMGGGSSQLSVVDWGHPIDKFERIALQANRHCEAVALDKELEAEA